MATTYCWNWGMKDAIEVNDAGVIDDNAKRAFMRGQCHALAIAIHRLTGALIVGICDSYDEEDSPGHCVVALNNGDYLDINGEGAFKKWSERYPCCKSVELKEEQAYKLRDYTEPIVKAAMPFARTLVEQYKNLLKESYA